MSTQFQAIPDTASFTFKYTLSGLIAAVSTFYARDVTVGWPIASLAAVAAALETWWSVNVRPLQHSGVTLVEIVAQDEGVENGLQTIESVGLAGTRAGDRGPYSVAALVQWVGDPGADPARGRTFHMGLVDADIDETSVAAAYRTSLDAAYTALAPAISAAIATAAQVIVSRYDGTELVPASGGQLIKRPKRRPVALTNTLADVRTRALIASQRDRRS